jgi:hypothetical protein
MQHSAPEYIVKSRTHHHLATGHTVQMSMNSGCTVFAKRLILRDNANTNIVKSVFTWGTDEHWKEKCKTHIHREPKHAISNHRSGLRCGIRQAENHVCKLMEIIFNIYCKKSKTTNNILLKWNRWTVTFHSPYTNPSKT